MAVLTLPTLTGAHPPAGFGAGGLQPGECCSLGLAVWGMRPLPCHTRPRLLSPRCCHSLLGTRLPRRALGSQRVGTAAFASAPVPGVSQVVPSHVSVALLSSAVTGCCFFPRGWRSRLRRITDISRYQPQLGTPAHSRGLCRCPAAHGDTATGGEGPRASAWGLAWGVGAEKWGCSMRAEGFALLSGGVGGLGFGGEYPSPHEGRFGVGGACARGGPAHAALPSRCREAPQALRRSPGCPGL